LIDIRGGLSQKGRHQGLPSYLTILVPRSLSENPFLGGCWKMSRCKASEILRSEAYLAVRRSDEE
jgi:hypothetical protein